MDEEPSSSAVRRAAFQAAQVGGLAVPGLVQFVPAVLSSFLIAEFTLDRGQLGLLLGAFPLSGALLSPVMGRTTDRIGGKKTLEVLYAAAVAALLLTAAAGAFLPLLAITFAAGVVAAAANPATNKLISTHLPVGRRGWAIGLKQAGGPLGILLAGATLPGLAGWLGWRPAIALSGLLPAAGLLLSVWSVPRDPPSRPLSRHSPKGRISREVIRLTVNGALVAGGTSALLGFLPLFAQEAVGFSAAGAGAVAGVVGVAGIGARLMWGWAAERMVSVSTSLLVISLTSVLASVAVWVSPAFGPGLLWAGAALAGASMLAWNSVGMLALLTLTPVERTGTASGIVLFGFLTGWAATPWIFGTVVDALDNYTVGWAMVTVSFLASAAILPTSRRSHRRPHSTE